MANTKDYRDRHVSPTAVSYVEKLNLPNLKRECIIRGIPFEMVPNSFPQLQSWFLHNYNNDIDRNRLNEYDEWAEAGLRARGADPLLMGPSFRLGTALENGPNGEIRKKRVKSRIPKMREKKARTTDGLYVGTKKAYTFELQKQGKTKAETIELVKAQFPEAKEKSIGIWYNKCKRLKGK
jgi:hypothetical protein